MLSIFRIWFLSTYMCEWGDEKMADENTMSCHATVCKPELL